MSRRRLNEKQIAAIAILSQPNRGGLTYEQVAKEVGVARSTIFEWKKNDTFHNELKAQIVRNTSDRLPDVFDSMVDNIIETGNAAAFRTLVQMHGLLTEKIEVDTKEKAIDTDELRERLKRMKSEEDSE